MKNDSEVFLYSQKTSDEKFFNNALARAEKAHAAKPGLSPVDILGDILKDKAAVLAPLLPAVAAALGVAGVVADAPGHREKRHWHYGPHTYPREEEQPARGGDEPVPTPQMPPEARAAAEGVKENPGPVSGGEPRGADAPSPQSSFPGPDGYRSGRGMTWVATR